MKYSYKEIFNSVKEIILEIYPNLDPEKITRHASLWLHLGIDNLDRIEMIMIIERKYNVHIKNENKLKTASSVEDFCNILYCELNGISEKEFFSFKTQFLNRIKNFFGKQY